MHRCYQLRFTFYSLQEVNTVALSNKNQRARTANIIAEQYALCLELVLLRKLHLTILRPFRTADLLSNSEHLLLKDYITKSVLDKKRHECSELTLIRLQLSDDLLVPHELVCRVFVFKSHNHFLAVSNKLMHSVRVALKSFTKSFENSGDELFFQ